MGQRTSSYQRHKAQQVRDAYGLHELPRTSDRYHSNVRWMCPVRPGLTETEQPWASALAITEQSCIIESSSCVFRYPSIFSVHKERQRETVTQLRRAYRTLQSGARALVVTQPVVVWHSMFHGSNSGHMLSALFGLLHQLRDLGLDDMHIALTPLAFRLPRIMELVSLYFPSERLVVLDTDTVYCLKEAWLLPVWYDHLHYLSMVEPWVRDVVRRLPWSRPVRNAVLLVKQPSHCVTRRSDVIEWSAEMQRTLKAAGFALLDPERDTMSTLIHTLQHASLIVTSFGSILYTHMLFYNPKATVIYLRHQHDPYPCLYRLVNRVEVWDVSSGFTATHVQRLCHKVILSTHNQY